MSHASSIVVRVSLSAAYVGIRGYALKCCLSKLCFVAKSSISELTYHHVNRRVYPVGLSAVYVGNLCRLGYARICMCIVRVTYAEKKSASLRRIK